MCKLCEDNKEIYSINEEDCEIALNGRWYLFYDTLCADNSGKEYGEAQLKINYCPLCGKKLV